jgi:RNA polymerase sigma-70 factor, ECF subfamily
MSDVPSHSAGPPALSAERQEEYVRLLNAAHPLLLRYAVSLLGHRHDAEDVLQRASVTMWRRFGSFAQGTDFTAWATTVVFYESRNFLRIMGRSRLHFDDELLELLAAERAEHVREWSPRADALAACVQKLSPSGQGLVQAIYHEGLTAPELAARDGFTAKAIYHKLSLLRRTLAECVQRQLNLPA